MRIAFISTIPVKDGHKSVQREQLFYNSLQACGHDMIPICPSPSLNYRQTILGRILRRGWRTIGYNCRLERSPWVLKAIADDIASQLKDLQIDLVFSLSSLYTAYLDVSVPMISWTDAVFESIIDFYDSHSRLDPLSILQGHRAEQRSLQNCALSILSSNWAATVASRKYSFPIERLRVINQGPTLVDIPETTDVIHNKRRKSGELRCIILGDDWLRKGGDVALAALGILRDKGLDASLTVIGIPVPDWVGSVPGLRCYPKLRKDNPNEWCIMKQAFLESDVYLLPSRADFTPNVIPEAYAFGLPVVGSSIGAIPEMIEYGETGFVVQRMDDANEYANYLFHMTTKPGLLHHMAVASRNRYETEYSRSVVARKLLSQMEAILYRAGHGEL